MATLGTSSPPDYRAALDRKTAKDLRRSERRMKKELKKKWPTI